MTGLHGVYDQPDAAAIHALFDRLIDYVTEKLPAVAEHLAAAREDILAFTTSPRMCGPRSVQQPRRAPQPRDPPPHRCRRDLPQPRGHRPPRRRRARRADRRMGRRTPLRRPPSPPTLPHHHRAHRRPRDRSRRPASTHRITPIRSRSVTPPPGTSPASAPLPLRRDAIGQIL
jgi:hypothetical protein